MDAGAVNSKSCNRRRSLSKAFSNLFFSVASLATPYLIWYFSSHLAVHSIGTSEPSLRIYLFSKCPILFPDITRLAVTWVFSLSSWYTRSISGLPINSSGLYPQTVSLAALTLRKCPFASTAQITSSDESIILVRSFNVCCNSLVVACNCSSASFLIVISLMNNEVLSCPNESLNKTEQISAENALPSLRRRFSSPFALPLN